jgi:hypothetical protein
LGLTKSSKASLFISHKKRSKISHKASYLVKTCIARIFLLSAGDRVTVYNHVYLGSWRYVSSVPWHDLHHFWERYDVSNMLTFWNQFLGHISPLAHRPVIARIGTSVLGCVLGFFLSCCIQRKLFPLGRRRALFWIDFQLNFRIFNRFCRGSQPYWIRWEHTEIGSK